MTQKTFPNGLRAIIANRPSAGVYCGIAVDAGTRDELPNESGIAHFTEHMTFKGTHRRSALQIINRLEGVGGELNAYTGKEETVYYSAVEPKHLPRALDLLFDIVFNSTYPEEEMRREAEVVADEIESYNDSPSELIFDEFDSLLFPNHPLGRNILGDAAALRSHTHAVMSSYAARLYRPDNAVIFISGPVDEDKILRHLEPRVAALMPPPPFVHTEAASSIPATPISGEATPTRPATTETPPLHLQPREAPAPTVPEDKTVSRNVHQAHVLIGGRSLPASHPERMALVLLNNILGGPGMNSRLNLSLRERSGLVYTVESNCTSYTDCGVWSVYFGCDKSDIRRCRGLVMRELDRLMQSPLSERTLSAAKRQLCGQLALSYDQHEGIATGMGKTFLHYGIYRTAPEIIERIQDVTSSRLQDMAQLTFSNLSSLTYI